MIVFVLWNVCPTTSNTKLYRDQAYALRFLTGLNDSASHVRRQILLKKALSHLNRIFSMVVQQESENNGDFLEEPKIAINAAIDPLESDSEFVIFVNMLLDWN